MHNNTAELLDVLPEEQTDDLKHLQEIIKQAKGRKDFQKFVETLSPKERSLLENASNDGTFNQEDNPIESAEEQVASAETKGTLAHILEQLKTLPRKALEILQQTAQGVWETWKNLPLPLRIASVITVIIGTPIAAMEILKLVNAGYAAYIAQILNMLIPEALFPEILKQAIQGIAAGNPAGAT